MRLKIPATSANLGPGFDCMGIAFDLYNYITFTPLENPGACELSVEGDAGKADLTKNNLIYKAFEATFVAAGEPTPGIKMHFENHVPFSRGLGSSSAAIMGGIKVANYLLKNRFNDNEMLQIALQFENHPDNITPALVGGITISGLHNGEVYFKKITPPMGLHCTVVIPNYPLSTKKAREVLPTSLTREDAVFNIGRTALLVDAFHTGDLDQLRLALEDRIHQPYRQSLIVGMEEVTAAAKALGAFHVTISGAGPTLLILHDGTADYSSIADILAQKQVEARVVNLHPITEGAAIIEE